MLDPAPRLGVADALDRAATGEALDAAQAEALLSATGEDLERLLRLAGATRDAGLAASGRPGVMTYSRKVFIPLTTLCRDRCHYCIFVDTPSQLRKLHKPAYMTPEQVLAVARQGQALGCKEALLTLGDRPEERWPEARAWLDEHGYASTLDYVSAMARLITAETGLLAHLNPGVMSSDELVALRPTAPSMGMMLETTSRRLYEEPGQVHFGSPDKDPDVRLRVIEDAGAARIPFTTGILVGIGETLRDRAESLVALRDVHARHGHVQEVIVQNFRAKPRTAMRGAADASIIEYVASVAVARLVLGPHMRVQVPPNLSDAAEFGLLVRAGADDWGGVSPLTADHVNPERPWPQIDELAARTAALGFALRERLTAHPEFVRDAATWIDPVLHSAVEALADAGTGLAAASPAAASSAPTASSAPASPAAPAPNPPSPAAPAPNPPSPAASMLGRRESEVDSTNGHGLGGHAAGAGGHPAGAGGHPADAGTGLAAASSAPASPAAPAPNPPSPAESMLGRRESEVDSTNGHGLGGHAAGLGAHPAGAGGHAAGAGRHAAGAGGHATDAGTGLAAASSAPASPAAPAPNPPSPAAPAPNPPSPAESMLGRRESEVDSTNGHGLGGHAAGAGGHAAGAGGRGTGAGRGAGRGTGRGAGGGTGRGAGGGAGRGDGRVRGLAQAAASDPLSLDDAEWLELLEATGDDLDAVAATADDVRRYTVGEAVTLVVNRNLTSSGFRARPGAPDEFDLDDAAAIATDAAALGATEICVQGLVPRGEDPSAYLAIARAIKAATPHLHLHAYRPQDVWDLADRTGLGLAGALAALREAGVDTVPGTGVKVLTERVRGIVAPGDLEIDRWTEGITAAHLAGLRSTSVLFYGHVETPAERIAHLRRLRAIQDQTHGFTEFVPIPLPGASGGVPVVAGRAPLDEHRAMVAVSRLLLSGSIPHIQIPWTRVGRDGASVLLQAGGDDLGGALLDGHVKPEAGVEHRLELPVADAAAMAARLFRPFRLRTTDYRTASTAATR
nr:7,8-didemethyl-8-hydroxy-5-deazariboflavin synthase CofG [Microbacterium ulmi]